MNFWHNHGYFNSLATWSVSISLACSFLQSRLPSTWRSKQAKWEKVQSESSSFMHVKLISLVPTAANRIVPPNFGRLPEVLLGIGSSEDILRADAQEKRVGFTKLSPSCWVLLLEDLLHQPEKTWYCQLDGGKCPLQCAIISITYIIQYNIAK